MIDLIYRLGFLVMCLWMSADLLRQEVAVSLGSLQ